MKVRTVYYLDEENKWRLEKDCDEYWLRAEPGGYNLVSLEVLKALHTALGLLLAQEVEE